MEAGKWEEMAQKALNIKCQDVQYGIEKPNPVSCSSSQSVKHGALDTKIAAPTPQKTYESVRNRHKDETAELPENYKVIEEFFKHMTCSLRLLALRKKSPTFENISRQVEVLSGRKFSCKHLSQIKHILPEAIHADKILVHDKKTLCVKPDIKITLSFDCIEGHQEQSLKDEDKEKQSPFITLQHLFKSRLLDLATKLPMVCEIPEAEMPEPFNRRINIIKIDPLREDLSTESQNSSSQTELLVNSTHLSPSFNKRFSKKMADETEKTPLLASQIHKTSVRHECSTDQGIVDAPRSTPVSDAVQLAQPSSAINSNLCETTPLKVEVEAGYLTLQTPAQLTPQRSVPSCDNKLKTMTNQNVTPYSAKRSLDFFVMEGEENISKSSSVEIDSLKFVDHTLHQTTERKGLLEEDNVLNSAPVLEKGEKGRCSSEDHSRNQTGVAPQQMHYGLFELIALIHQTFQSVSYPAITKDELIYKIIINSCDIVERREVEEQIQLLEKLVPDWICSKLVPSGDVLYNIKKQSDPNSVCRMLHDQVAKMREEMVN